MAIYMYIYIYISILKIDAYEIIRYFVFILFVFIIVNIFLVIATIAEFLVVEIDVGSVSIRLIYLSY